MPSQQKFDRKLGVRQEPALLDLALKVLSLDEVGDVVLIAVLLALLHVLVALGELAEGGKGVGAELVEDARDELGELLVLTVAVDGEGVGGNGGVDCDYHVRLPPLHLPNPPKNGTYPWARRSG
ncbi:hypothetical protein VDGD_20520 [Verticillium dahliae]|nr:hypothetical protein VDGD_20520 [Verticillium dahliae]